jgi:hypothetical protein
LVVHAAVRVLPLPASATALQPEIDVPPSVKLIVPVGAKPVVDAVKVTFTPGATGLLELDKLVLLVALLTTCDRAALVDVLLLASPL